MGRGRQKAKHQKVARDLKYHTSTIDVSALERELSGDVQTREYGDSYDDDDDDDDDESYGDPYADDDDED